MANPSRLQTELQPDEPVQLTADYSLNALDRRKIDNQILAVQQHMADSMLNGLQASWYLLSTGSAILQPGDVFVSNASIVASNGNRVVIKASAGTLNDAGMALAIALGATPPGGRVRGAWSGVLESSVTGLAAANPGPVRVNVTTGRCERVDALDIGDYPLGFVDASGNLTLSIERVVTATGGSGGPGGTATQLTALVAFDVNVPLSACPQLYAGVTITEGKQVLLINQDTPSENYLYTFGHPGGGGTAPLIRSSDTIPLGAILSVQQGTNLNNGKTYYLASATDFEPTGVVNDVVTGQYKTTFCIGQDMTAGGRGRSFIWRFGRQAFPIGTTDLLVAAFDSGGLGFSSGVLFFSPVVIVDWDDLKAGGYPMNGLARAGITAGTATLLDAGSIKGGLDGAQGTNNYVSMRWFKPPGTTVFQLLASNTRTGPTVNGSIAACYLGWILEQA